METTLDPKVQPFLYDHRIDGTPVLPGVMGIEAFAEAAQCVHPGWHVEAVEEVNFLSPFKFYRDEPRTVTVQAVYHPQGDRLLADCRLIGRRTLPNHPEPQETIHFTARVRLSKQHPDSSDGEGPGDFVRLHHWSRRNLSRVLPRTSLPSPGAGLVGWNAHDRSDGRTITEQSPAIRPADADGATPDRACASRPPGSGK